MGIITSILAITLRAGTSLVYATIGETYTERVGIMNLGLEGIMLMGAVTSFATAYYSGSLILAIIVAICVGALLSLLHAFLCVTMRANQVVSGLAITLFGTGFSSFLGERLGPVSNGRYLAGLSGPKVVAFNVGALGDIPILGAFLRQDIFTWLMYIIIPLAWYYMFKTRNGLFLRSIGENPRTADAMGVNVNKLKYIYTVLGGILTSIGGAHLALGYTPGWSENITGGRGWIVIALVIFSMWNPARAITGALIFGGINAVQFRLQASGTTIPSGFLNMLPYLATIVALIIMTCLQSVNKRAGGPQALSVPYVREDK